MQTVVYTASPGAELDRILSEADPKGLFILVDSNTRRHALPLLLADSKRLADAVVIEIPAGDDNKRLENLALVWKELQQGGATRKSLLVNLGGGMITDLGGFAAAAFKRGIRFVNVPTTLLGAVDAAVGGKTGINLGGLKNEIGVFAEAMAVVVSPLFFSTLPPSELMSGYGEVIKHGLLSGPDALNRVLGCAPAGLSATGFLSLLTESVEVKRRIVAEDPREQGLRKALNLGHTAAHAFESLAFSLGKPVAHGNAVAWGLVVDLVLSNMLLRFPSGLLSQVAAYVRENYPAPAFTCDDYPQLLEYMRHDKKNADAGHINFTLLRAPGQVEIDRTVDEANITAALDIFRDLLQ